MPDVLTPTTTMKRGGSHTIKKKMSKKFKRHNTQTISAMSSLEGLHSIQQSSIDHNEENYADDQQIKPEISQVDQETLVLKTMVQEQIQQFDSEQEQMKIKLYNARIFVINAALTFLIGDCAFYLPSLVKEDRKWFPNLLGIVLGLVVSIPLYIGIAHSLLKKKLGLIRWLLVIVIFRCQFEMWNMPREGSVNFSLRRMVKSQTISISQMASLKIASELFKDYRRIIVSNIIVLVLTNVQIIALHIKPDGLADVLPLTSYLLPQLMVVIIYCYVNKQNMLVNIRENVMMFEYDQYKEMFNSLQEGVIVISANQDVSQPSETSSFKVFFANELMQAILFKVCNISATQPHDKNFLQLTDLIRRKVFFPFQNKIHSNHSTDRQRRASFKRKKSSSEQAYSIVDILSLTQNELSQMVFSFSSKKRRLIDTKHSTTEMQRVL